MRNLRLIARLDVKGSYLIKGVQLEGLRKIGVPNDYARRYYQEGIDEIIYMDSVASLYGRNSLDNIIKHTAKDVFVPITVGGGIRSIDDVARMLDSGADKVAINTAAILKPSLITEVSKQFGTQCMVLSVEAKSVSSNKWEVYHDNGREKTGIDVIYWIKQAIDLGAGEILLTSVDKEGTCKGFDIQLVNAIAETVSIPVIASGGMGKLSDLTDLLNNAQPDAVAIAHVLHLKKCNISEIRNTARAAGRLVR